MFNVLFAASFTFMIWIADVAGELANQLAACMYSHTYPVSSYKPHSHDGFLLLRTWLILPLIASHFFPQIMLVAILPRLDEYDRRRMVYTDMMKLVAGQYGAYFVDCSPMFSKANLELWCRDGLHLSENDALPLLLKRVGAATNRYSFSKLRYVEQLGMLLPKYCVLHYFLSALCNIFAQGTQ